MNSIVKSERVPVNPRMLAWAREQAGKTIEEVSVKFNNIASWEQKKSSPTVKQARDLAEFYNRSFLEFFRTHPPELKQPKYLPDFRMSRGAPEPNEQPRLKAIQQWAEAQRENALDLIAELGEQPKTLSQYFFSTIKESPEEVAQRVRELLSFSFDEQLKVTYSKRNEIVNILRNKIEGLGVMVLKNNELQVYKARGMCLAELPLPVIVFGKESPGAQLFTMLHELAHIILKQSGIVGYIDKTTDKPIENWCDQFAASFLMPNAEVKRYLGNVPNIPAKSIGDEELLTYAKFFRVSPHAMLIRLVHLNYIESSYYWDVKKPAFEKDEKNYEFYGRSSYYGSRYKSSLGDFYTGLVMEAWSTGRITNHNAAEYMGIKKISHLFDIRDSFHK